MAPPPEYHGFQPSQASPNRCSFCRRGEGSPYHQRFCQGCQEYHALGEHNPDATPFCNRCGTEHPWGDHVSFPESSDSSDDELEPVDAPLPAEFGELQRHSLAIQDFASRHFSTHLPPGFTHPLQFALYLMKLGLQSLSLPPSKPTLGSPPPHPTHADCGVQATPPPLPVRSFASASSQASPPAPPARVLADATSQTTTPPARVLADAASQTAPPATLPPRPTRTTSRSPSPKPTSPSTRAIFDEVLAHLTALRKEISPPPSSPATPRAVSPAPCADDPHPSITVVVPYDTTSLSVDRVDHPIYAWRFKIATASPTAPVQRGRPPCGRPLAAFDTSRPP
ncbi:hypothetical protein V8D89_003621 [Ganoderma adspersum]